MCEQRPVQACSCCPKAFCASHAVSEAYNAQHPIVNSGGCQMFVCNFCNYNPDRIKASYVHAFCLDQDCYPQDLFTADGLWVSKYLKNPVPPLSAVEFTAQCYVRDLTTFEYKVLTQSNISCVICP